MKIVTEKIPLSALNDKCVMDEIRAWAHDRSSATTIEIGGLQLTKRTKGQTAFICAADKPAEPQPEPQAPRGAGGRFQRPAPTAE